jgi:hypothetical protein
VRQALRKAMKPMADRVRENVPEGGTGAMKETVKLRALPRSRRGFGVQVEVESPGVRAVEFGTSL